MDSSVGSSPYPDSYNSHYYVYKNVITYKENMSVTTHVRD